MGKRLGVLGVAVALIALTVGAIGPAFGSSGDDDTKSTIRVVSITEEFEELDHHPEGESLGDQFVFSSKLLKDGDEVGHDGVVCTLVSVERQEGQCVATAWFDDGQITVQGLINFTEDPPAVPITGGSGKYEGAEGELHIRPVSETKEVLTFHLED